jgi:hypothetical protein
MWPGNKEDDQGKLDWEALPTSVFDIAAVRPTNSGLAAGSLLQDRR